MVSATSRTKSRRKPRATDGGSEATAAPAQRARARSTPSRAPRRPESPVAAATARKRRPAAPSGDSAAATPRPRAPSKSKTTAPRATRARAAKPQEDGAAGAKGKSLVIVESPAKSRTLTKFLGRGFSVLASNGHIMDLPKGKLGVDLDNDFEPVYEPIASKHKAMSRIKEAAKHAERIFLAPDPDREGEAIAWHLQSSLQSLRRPFLRLTFNEITQRAVQHALEHPRALDMNLVNAQQARRVLDRLVGYKVSPFVWKKVRYGLSAGRVQSVALRLVCEREDAIRAFVPVEYWTLEADFFTPADERFTTRLVRVGDDDLEQGQMRGADAGALARSLAAELAGAPARVASVESTPKQVHPRPPFITSTLQQAAVNRLGFTSQRTMKVAQQLYEGVALGSRGSVGLITYMRTDSPRMAGEAIAAIRTWLEAHLGADYVPDSPRQFKSRKSAQDAHEAIRPTSVEHTPDSMRGFLNDEQFKLYDLIWKRAVSAQASSAEYQATTIEVESGRLGLRATGRVLKFAGFQKLYGLDEEDDERDSRLPEVSEGLALRVAAETDGAEPSAPVRPEQHFTQPPPRYTEASLVKALEEENIGRPSTYATIVGTITSRTYVERDGRSLKPTDLGMTVNKLLVEAFPDVFNVSFTAAMEEELDEIEEGKQEWHHVIHDFWGPFQKDLAQAEKSTKKVEEPTEIPCPNDGAMLVKKFGRRGPFLACPNYPTCKYTRPVDDAELPTPIEGQCPDCSASLVVRNGPYGRFISCSRRPDCKFTKPVTLGIPCPECGQGEIVERRSKRGKIFYGCTRYPDCTFAAWDKPRLTPCPNCGAPFLVEKETKKHGLVLRCVRCKSQFEPETVGA
ncbi:MAG TPA: type I DNA topoisomerase [Candidatus Limnocylindria bacterium]|nr:type I DNA topoisomerase [Candidatus Limnocylindria bacterium]